MRLLILGTGGMAETHAERFGAIDGVSIVATVDPNEERLVDFSNRHKVGQRFADLDAALAWDEFDSVANVTPDAVHYPTTMRLIAAGKHVFCEKPLATAHPFAWEMADAAEARGIVNMVNLTYRASPALHRAREMVLAGTLGVVRHFDASYMQSWLVSSQWGDWRSEDRWLWRLSTQHGSKGVVGDIGIHIIDFATYAAASDVAAFSPRVKTFHKAPGDRIGVYTLDANDSFVMTAELRNGALGSIEATRFGTGHANDLHVGLYGDKGAAIIQTNGAESSLRVCLGPDIDTNTWREEPFEPVPTTYQRFAAAVAAGINGDPSFRRAADLQRVLDLVLAAGASDDVKVS